MASANGENGRWTEQYTVRTHETTLKGTCTVPALLSYLQEAAVNHATSLGLSREHLIGEGETWVLNRLSIRMNRFPRRGDTISVTTWPSGVNRLVALRDFRVDDGGGDEIGHAVSSWVVIDVDSRRPKRLDGLLENIRRFDHASPSLTVPARLQAADMPGSGRMFEVRFADIDINRHVNNIAYCTWIVESLPYEILAGKTLRELDINFLAEAYYGQTVRSVVAPSVERDAAFVHLLSREQDDTELVRAVTVWE